MPPDMAAVSRRLCERGLSMVCYSILEASGKAVVRLSPPLQLRRTTIKRRTRRAEESTWPRFVETESVRPWRPGKGRARSGRRLERRFISLRARKFAPDSPEVL